MTVDFKQSDRIIYKGEAWDNDTHKPGVVVAVDGLLLRPNSPYNGLGKITVFLDGETKSRRVTQWEIEHEPAPERVLDEEPYVKLYREFWADIVEDEDGNFIPDQIMRELSDFHLLLTEVPKAYSSLTGGAISKANTAAEHVIDYAEEHAARWIAEELNELTISELHEWIQKNLD